MHVHCVRECGVLYRSVLFVVFVPIVFMRVLVCLVYCTFCRFAVCIMLSLMYCNSSVSCSCWMDVYLSAPVIIVANL